MDNSTGDRLRELIRAVDPTVLLLPPRTLRRIIKLDRHWSGLGLHVPHRKSYVISRETLVAIARRHWIRIPTAELPSVVTLLPASDAAELTPQLCINYWRLLFHSAIHRELNRRNLDRAAVAQRIEAIGAVEWLEVRSVLRHERFLLPPNDERSTYEEFVAVWLELQQFAPQLLQWYFPSVDPQRVREVVCRDIGIERLFEATRLPECSNVSHPNADGGVPELVVNKPVSLSRRVQRAAKVGNDVRAAILRARANEPSHELEHLAQRLQAALELDSISTASWTAAFESLLRFAVLGVWPAEARLLYDLQKVCVEMERPTYSTSIAEWATARGRQALVRELPERPYAMVVQYLRAAQRRLPATRLNPSNRERLSNLLHEAIDHADARLRSRLRATVDACLQEAGLRPVTFAEQMARDKVVEELLDKVVENGFLKFGDVRDVLSRNRFKLPDLADCFEADSGDGLIRVNHEFAEQLPGVYRRGEVYLRGLEWLSSLTFGTSVGRVLMRFLVMPLGAAYATLIFVQEMLHLARIPHHWSQSTKSMTVAALAVFYFSLIQFAWFRTSAKWVSHLVAGTLQALFIRIPGTIWRWPPVRAVLASNIVRWLGAFTLKPLPIAALVGLVLHRFDLSQSTVMTASAVALVVTSIVINSPAGRRLEEAVVDHLLSRWFRLRGLIPGLMQWILDLFHSWMEAIDRGLYAVDEMLRFRRGQGALALAAKIILGTAWSIVAYVIRLIITVFFEPTFNPVKHFPTVTVAAKMLVPLWIPMTHFFTPWFEFLGHRLGQAVAFNMIHIIPGAAGFLVWELKENWKLFAANRPTYLRPCIVGHHGETMIRMLRPGFHSGTLPRLFAKLRRAGRKAKYPDDAATQYLESVLEEVVHSIQHFAERDFVHPLNVCGMLPKPIDSCKVSVATNQVRFAFSCSAVDPSPFILSLIESDGLLVGEVADSGWTKLLAGEARDAVALAVSGFFQSAGVDRKSGPLKWSDWVNDWERVRGC